MRFAFVVGFPTQFEVPFYKFIEKFGKQNYFLVIYLQENNLKDPELNQINKWGINMLDGYCYVCLDHKNIEESFKNILLKDHFDLIIFNGYKKKYARLFAIAREFNKRNILRFDTVLFNKSMIELFLRKLFLLKKYRQFDAFLATGTASKEYLLKMGLSDSKIKIFSYCTDEKLFIDRKCIEIKDIQSLKNKFRCENKNIILVVSKLIERETPWDVFRAIIHLNDDNIKLIVIGDGIQRKRVERFLNKYPNLDVSMLGYVPYLDLPQYYQIADIFIHAAKDEPWGVSVQEAIQCGAAVITSDHVGSAADLIIEGKNGKIYPYGDYKKLSHAILQVLNYDRGQIEAANSKVLEKWNYQWMWNQIISSVNN